MAAVTATRSGSTFAAMPGTLATRRPGRAVTGRARTMSVCPVTRCRYPAVAAVSRLAQWVCRARAAARTRSASAWDSTAVRSTAPLTSATARSATSVAGSGWPASRSVQYRRSDSNLADSRYRASSSTSSRSGPNDAGSAGWPVTAAVYSWAMRRVSAAAPNASAAMWWTHW
ncbi:hypothetical protein Pa4123_13030 [Phytohabitans aurantiacus]|uniref:Uncharacterized protein n=1 Tax=Phytohabitans aurantiacus TaxID=3016789 RepID=A0ABQ5QRU0_9ACTN|nr:hypothetical protein Pa4123_13030 [Phytohabitans aurantiacus]